MVTYFNNQSQNKPQYLGKLNNGYVKAWGFFGFWIGKTSAGLQASPNPTAANNSVRDGIYISNDPAVTGKNEPVIMPWTGEVWILNDGTQPTEQVDNVVFIDMENVCA